MLELMVVVAILAILATLALPSFQARVIRGQVIEARSVADFVRQAVADGWRNTGRLAADNATAGVPPADRIVGRYVARVEVADGAVVLTFGNQAQSVLTGRRLVLRPAVVEGYPQVPVAWICAGADVPKSMTVHGKDTTDLPANYLPLDCRAGATRVASAPKS